MINMMINVEFSWRVDPRLTILRSYFRSFSVNIVTNYTYLDKDHVVLSHFWARSGSTGNFSFLIILYFQSHGLSFIQKG